MLASTCLSFCVIIWALQLSRRVATAEANALVDPLTGVFNRRGWNALVGRETARSQRERTSMTVFVMDIDEFKFVNDRYGHARGDQVLKDVASAIRGSARANDVVARLGGDEFALLVLEDGSTEALLERLDRALASIGVSLSVGYATTQPGTDVGAATEAADRLMYHNKESRRTQGTITVTGKHATLPAAHYSDRIF
jgi:diguanylate cyclase (GGDEF)-like protein